MLCYKVNISQSCPTCPPLFDPSISPKSATLGDKMNNKIHHLIALLLLWATTGFSQDWTITLTPKMTGNGQIKKFFVLDSSKNVLATREISGDQGAKPYTWTIEQPYRKGTTIYLLQHRDRSLEYQLNAYFNMAPQITLQDPAEHDLVVEEADLFDTMIEIDSVYAVNDFLYNVTTAGNNEHYKLKRHKLQIYFQRNLKLDYCFYLRVNNSNRYQYFYLNASAPKAKKIKTSVNALSGYLESCTVFHYDSTIKLGQIRATNESTGHECFFYDVPRLQNDSSVTFFIPRGYRWKNNYLQLESNQNEFKDGGGTSYSYFKTLTDWKDFIPSYWYFHQKPSEGWTRETLPENGYTREIDISEQGYLLQTSFTGVNIAYLNTHFLFDQQGEKVKRLGNLEQEPLPKQLVRYLVDNSHIRMYSNEGLIFSQDFGTLSTAFLTDEGYQLSRQMPNLVFTRRNQPKMRVYMQTVIEPAGQLKEFIYTTQ